MPKDSQVDTKKVRKQKSNGQITTSATENKNNNKNAKRQSTKNNDV